MKTQTSIKYYRILILISIVITWIIFFFFSTDELINLTKEDGIIESLGALFLLASSMIFFITFLRDKNCNDLFLFKTNKNYFFLFFAILFFLGFGEELSWGQRIFNLQTPEAFTKINFQNETNLHNLKMFNELGLLNANHLFTYFWVTYCLIIPLLYNKSSIAAKWLNKINLPIVPLWLAIFFLLSYSISLVLKFGFDFSQSVTEVKEASISSLFLIFSIICLTKNHN